jgi:hypothetical protein
MKPVTLLLLCGLLCGRAIGAEMTNEETIVRTAYAKLSYAVDLNTAYELSQDDPKIGSADLASQVERAGLRFKLVDFAFGNLADIAEAKYTDTFPQYDDGLQVIRTTLAIKNRTEVNGTTLSMETVAATWGAPPEGRAPDATVSQLMPELAIELEIEKPTRYCTFTVTVTLAGKSRTYRAAFLFGANGEAAAMDPVTGNGGLIAHFLRHPVYPSVLLQSKTPAIKDFLTAKQRTGSGCRPGEACCDPETLYCGVFSADLVGRFQ